MNIESKLKYVALISAIICICILFFMQKDQDYKLLYEAQIDEKIQIKGKVTKITAKDNAIMIELKPIETINVYYKKQLPIQTNDIITIKGTKANEKFVFAEKIIFQ